MRIGIQMSESCYANCRENEKDYLNYKQLMLELKKQSTKEWLDYSGSESDSNSSNQSVDSQPKKSESVAQNEPQRAQRESKYPERTSENFNRTQHIAENIALLDKADREEVWLMLTTIKDTPEQYFRQVIKGLKAEMQQNKEIIHVFPDKHREDAWTVKVTIEQARKLIQNGVDADNKVVVQISPRSKPRERRQGREGRDRDYERRGGDRRRGGNRGRDRRNFDEEDRNREGGDPRDYGRRDRRGGREDRGERGRREDGQRREKRVYIDKQTGKPVEPKKKHEKTAEQTQRQYSKREAERKGMELGNFRNKPKAEHPQETVERESEAFIKKQSAPIESAKQKAFVPFSVPKQEPRTEPIRKESKEIGKQEKEKSGPGVGKVDINSMMDDIRQPAPSLKPIDFSAIQMSDEEAQRRLNELNLKKQHEKKSKNEADRKGSGHNEIDSGEEIEREYRTHKNKVKDQYQQFEYEDIPYQKGFNKKSKNSYSNSQASSKVPNSYSTNDHKKTVKDHREDFQNSATDHRVRNTVQNESKYDRKSDNRDYQTKEYDYKKELYAKNQRNEEEEGQRQHHKKDDHKNHKKHYVSKDGSRPSNDHSKRNYDKPYNNEVSNKSYRPKQGSEFRDSSDGYRKGKNQHRRDYDNEGRTNNRKKSDENFKEKNSEEQTYNKSEKRADQKKVAKKSSNNAFDMLQVDSDSDDDKN